MANLFGCIVNSRFHLPRTKPRRSSDGRSYAKYTGSIPRSRSMQSNSFEPLPCRLDFAKKSNTHNELNGCMQNFWASWKNNFFLPTLRIPTHVPSDTMIYTRCSVRVTTRRDVDVIGQLRLWALALSSPRESIPCTVQSGSGWPDVRGKANTCTPSSIWNLPS